MTLQAIKRLFPLQSPYQNLGQQQVSSGSQ
jgi:hypothetical protein